MKSKERELIMGTVRERKDVTVMETLIDANPCVNVIGKDDFDDRVREIFKIIGECLSRSLGPYGAPSIISQYPYHHITKDGFTIMKNIHFDKTSGFIDQVVADMAADICGRLNYSVGDGTTSAIVSTNCIYESYIQNKDKFSNWNLLPRDILGMYEEIKKATITELEKRAKDIRHLPKEEMLEEIRRVVYISSNANEEITDMIVGLYDEIEYPAITVSVAADGVGKSKVVNGFLHESALTDRLYINNDNETLSENNCDVVIFDHKVNIDEYRYILRPISMQSEQCGRKLICLAPMYDDVMMQNEVIPDLNKIYKVKKELPLILMGYKNTSEHYKKRIADLAMLTGTRLISQEYARNLVKDYLTFAETVGHNSSENIGNAKWCFDLMLRNIPGISIMVKDTNSPDPTATTIITSTGNETADILTYPLTDNALEVGFVGHVELGLNTSIYNDFYYDEDIYNACVAEAEKELNDATEKFKKLGTFNVAVSQCQNRLNSLKLRMGTIEVGASSEFSQTYLKDAVDDAVKAAESAYNNGIVLGCHVTLLGCLNDIREKCIDTLPQDGRRSKEAYEFLIDILIDGFKSVFHTVLDNRSSMTISYENPDATDYPLDLMDKLCELTGFEHLFDGVDVRKVRDIFDNIIEVGDVTYDVNDILIELAVGLQNTLDLGKEEFNTEVINSAATDKEILTATIDLIALLITGNQLVISRPR